MLVENYISSLTSIQKALVRSKNREKSVLLRKFLTTRASGKADLVLEVQNKIDAIYLKELEERFQQKDYYNCIKNKRMNDYFLGILNSPHGNIALSSVVNRNGIPIGHNHGEYIASHYEKLFNPPPTSTDITLTDFISPELYEHPLIEEKLLNVSEVNEMSKLLSLSEMDSAITSLKRKKSIRSYII